MITKALVKTKSEELNISFSNLLSAAVCETVIEIISKSRYGQDLYLMNSSDFEEESIRNLSISKIKYEYSIDVDGKMLVLYLRDILKEILAKAALDSLAITGYVEENEIRLKVTVDDMYIPISVCLHKISDISIEIKDASISFILDENIKIAYKDNPKEEALAKNLAEILEKLELINDMDIYLNTYEILKKYPLSGRKVKEYLDGFLAKKNIIADEKRMNLFVSYRDNTYMKKKWKVLLRQKKKSEPTWTDLMDCLLKFIGPIWETVQSGYIFMGDWMPQLSRFLD